MVSNVLEYLKKAATDYPWKVGFCDSNGYMTFEEINRNAQSIGTQIMRYKPNMRKKPIAVYMDKSAMCLCAFFGVVYSGNFYVPLDVNSPLKRIEKIIDVLRPEVILTQKKFAEILSKNYYRDNVIIADEKTESDERALHLVWEQHIDADPLYTLFTSGSTGLPKGVVVTHRAVINHIEWLSDFFEINQQTVFGNQVPFHFDVSVADIYATLRNAAQLYIIPERLFSFPGELLSYLEERKINTIFWVPSALISIANSNALQLQDHHWLKKVLFAGEVMPNKQLNRLRKELPDALFANLYGPTEATVVCTCYLVDREFKDDESLPIGKACGNTELLVLNEKQQLCNIGEVGELCIRGAGVAAGYYGDSEKGEAVFIQNPINPYWKDPVYRTGDLVYYNSFGELEYVGRMDDQIKYNGYRIELGEIEQVTTALEGIKRVCAIYDRENKKIMLAVTGEEFVTEKQIYKELKERLPRYMLPARIIILDMFPLNSNGKIDRLVLKDRLEGV